jgi:hypothetical protein
MDEQRLERLLRAGPPFATPYVARPLVLPEPAAPAPVWGARRLALLLAIVALLLAASVVGALLSGIFRESVVAVVMDDPGGNRSYSVSVFYSSGREETIYLPIGDPFWIEDFAWSNDGQRLAFTAGERGSRGDTLALYTMHADGSDLRRVTKPTTWVPCGWTTAGEPMQWAPNDDAIAFCIAQYDPDGLRTQLKVVDLASSEITKLDNGKNESFGPFKFSPDGQWLAYRRQTSGNSLWLSPVDGSTQPILLANVAEGPGGNGQQGIQDFAWSPQSDAVAYGVDSGGASTLEVVWLDQGRSPLPIPALSLSEGLPNVLYWTDDNELIYLGQSGTMIGMVTIDGRTRGVVRGWGSGASPPWVKPDGSIDWSKTPWVASGGRSVHWWEDDGSSSCLMTAEVGTTRRGICVRDEEFAGGAPGHPMAPSEHR